MSPTIRLAPKPDVQLSSAKMPICIGASMKTGISAFGSWMLGIGSIIGSMAWLIHAPMLARSGAVGSMAAWAIAGVLVIPLALILMELSSMFPSAGGPYLYKYYALKRLMPKMGELLGFLTGWLFWAALIVGLACMANGLVNLLTTSVWGSSGNSPIWFGSAVIFALFGATTFLNCLSVERVSKIANLFTIMKIGMVVTFVGLVFSTKHWSISNALQFNHTVGGANIFQSVSSVLMLALAGFAFLECTACTSSETVNPQKSVPRAVLLTLFSVTFIYLIMCFAVSISSPFSLSVDGTSLVVAGTSIQANCPALAGYLGGSGWGIGFTACVIASIVGCSFSALMALARVGYSMAETKLFPHQFAHLHPVTKVPVYALAFQFWCVCIIGCAANLLSRSGAFVDAYTFLGETFGFMYAFVAMLYGFCAVSLRYTDPELPRLFRIGTHGNWLVWLMAAVTAGIWGYAAFGCVNWTHQVAGSLILLLGVPIFFYYRRANRSQERQVLSSNQG